MNRSDFKEKFSFQSIGREALVAIVVFFSSLSFALGFFVGKWGKEPPAAAPKAAETATPAQTDNTAETVKQQTATPTTAVAGPATSTGQGGGWQTGASKPQQETPLKTNAAEPAKTVEQAKVQKKDEARPYVKDGPDGKDEEAKEQIYAVQLGAFKSASEAKKIRLKYDKKGYKTYIIELKKGKGEKIFKVKTGRFQNKEDAEALSKKLRKTDGAQAFVTLRDE